MAVHEHLSDQRAACTHILHACTDKLHMCSVYTQTAHVHTPKAALNAKIMDFLCLCD